MKTPVCISKIWPPPLLEEPSALNGDFRYVPGLCVITVFKHRDGRMVEYVRGVPIETAEAKDLLRRLGNICGTVGSVEIWEAFPGEMVCLGCVAAIQSYWIAENGDRVAPSYIYREEYANGVKTHYCPSCREREELRVRQQYEHDMRILAMDLTYLRSQTASDNADGQGSVP